MKIIGFHWDHNSSVALLEGDRITASVSEERFSGLKNDSRFPVRAAQFCIEKAGGKNAIDGVAIATLDRWYDFYLLNVHNSFTLSDFVREQHEVWKPLFYQGVRDRKYRDLFPQYIDRNQHPVDYWSQTDQDDLREKSFPGDVNNLVAAHFDLPPEKIKRFDHHWCHARYAFHSSRFHDDPVLILTIDGAGDGANATITLKEGDQLTRHYSTPDCTLGRYYRHITLMMGMRPLEHEYKLMGLSPYGRGKEVDRVCQLLHETLSVDGIRFIAGPRKPTDSYFSFRDLFEGYRFDHIAAGLQRWTEEMLELWVCNVIKHFGVRKVAIGGGVAMNVKAMGRIAQLADIDRLYVPGSSSDESNSIGAALCMASEKGISIKRAVSTLYLGPEAGNTLQTLRTARERHEIVIEKPTPDQIAKTLLAGVVIGRCIGKMEFGQRALGNRSILADPLNISVVSCINEMIKNRDFWMPFAPVILDRYESKYLQNRNSIESPHMTIAFQTTRLGFHDLRAACHPSDETVRAQILKKDHNPDFYDLLDAFERLTGRGGLLNTSFNLHGYPIVRDVTEAYNVFTKTKLDALLVADAMIIKPSTYTERDLDSIFQSLSSAQ